MGSASALCAQTTTVIKESVTGTVAGASTTDTLGLFGTAGASLAGKAITIHYQYVPADFNVSAVCRSSPLCTYDESNTVSEVSGSVTISVTINGTTQVYAPVSISEVIFANQLPNSFYIYSDAGTFGYGLRGCSVAIEFESPVVFGEPFSPTNQPVEKLKTDMVNFFVPSDDLPGETLNFEVTGAKQ